MVTDFTTAEGPFGLGFSWPAKDSQPAAHRPRAPSVTSASLEFRFRQLGAEMLGQHKTTRMEPTPPSPPSLNIAGLNHTLLAFCNASLASVGLVLHISALLLLAGGFPGCRPQRRFASIRFDGQVFRGSWQMPISLQIYQFFNDFKEK